MSPAINRSHRILQLPAVAVASAVIGLIAALLSVSTVKFLPPKVEARPLTVAGATTHVMVDLPTSLLRDRSAGWEYFNVVNARADLLARVMASQPAVTAIGRRARIAPDRIAAVAPVTADVQSVLTEPGSEQRAREILLSRRPYRLEVQSRPLSPLIDIYTQAPTPAEAEHLADAVTPALRLHLRALARREGFDPDRQVRLRQLGPARGAVLNPRAALKIAGLTFVVAFALAFFGLLALGRLRAVRGRAAPNRSKAEPPAAALPPRGIGVAAAGQPQPSRLRWSTPDAGQAIALPLNAAWLRLRWRQEDGGSGDWPHTSRLLPWMVAAFMAVVWLVPIDSIEMNLSLPVDLKFDRLVLPFVIAAWLLAWAAGRAGAPRMRLTWTHAAVGAFVTLAWLSVVFDAGELNRLLELDTTVKKLPLLLAYLSIFLMVASVVRRSEVVPFLKYTLVLAVICGLGIILEYRTEYNAFFELPDKLLPGIFDVAMFDSGWDLGGRRATRGPALHGLVAVAMLALAMPIALVGIIHAEDWRGRVWYGLALGVLVVAVLATQRKTAVVAPLAGVLTLAYFRRRELLRLAPVGVALLVALVIASPGTVEPVITQFQPERLGADTVSDRASDYDAVRPDVWTHLLLGRGYGSYQPVGHRILDSEILVRTVEMGVLGLIAFLFLGISVVMTTRRLIASRHPLWAPPALAGAAAAVIFIVVAAVFDSMSYPQVPYVFLFLAALVAALPKPTDEDVVRRAEPS